MPTPTMQLLNTTFRVSAGAASGASTVVSLVLAGAPELAFPTGRLVVTLAHSATRVPLVVEMRSVWTDSYGNRQVTPLETNQGTSGQSICVAAGPVVGSGIEIAIMPAQKLPVSVGVSGVLAVWGA